MTAKELLIRANNELIDAQSLAENCENYELLRRKMDSARRNLRSVLCVLDLKRFGYKVDSFEEISKIAHRHERFKETMKQWYESTKADAIQRLNMYKESGMRIANALQEITVTFGRDYFPNHIKLLGQLRMYTFLRLMLLGQLRYVDCKLEKARLKVSWHNKIIETSINKLDEVIKSPYKYCYLFPFVTASTSALLEALKDFRQSVTEELKAQVQKTDVEAYIYSDTYTRVTDQMRRLPNLIKAFKSIDRATKDLETIKKVVIYQLNWAAKLSSELSNVASLSNEQLLQLEQLLSKIGVSPADFQQFLAGDAMGNTMSILGYSMYGFNTLLDCLGQSPSAVIAEVEERLRPKLMKNKTQKDSVSGSLTESKAQLNKSLKNLQEAYKKMISTFSKLKAPKIELPPLLPGQFMA
jgi:DnaJ-domain-containing protein 1